MLFNSFVFIYLFLPITVLAFFALRRFSWEAASLVFLVLASLFFYSYWNVAYLALILLSIIVNYFTGLVIVKERSNSNFVSGKISVCIGVLFNLALIGYYKYSYFIADTFSVLGGYETTFEKILLPLAISFFTFQQIAYLVDCYKDQAAERSFLRYALFVCFFPQLIAGPIVHHKEMLPQFTDSARFKYWKENTKNGLTLFSIGLFKKVVIADTFAVWANEGYSASASITFLASWVATLSYTFQLYFDFSGYSDMAIGLALLFGIKLPQNFNSPYRAVNIQDFWRRWHMTLSRFLRDYVYIPLGGGRMGGFITSRNLFLTFLIGGIWHGAGWTFVAWGVFHGAAVIVQRLWVYTGVKISRVAGWFVTFLFVHLAWVVFRAEDWEIAVAMYQGMLGKHGLGTLNTEAAVFILIFGAVAFAFKNSLDLVRSDRKNIVLFISICAYFLATLQSINASFSNQNLTEFLYFNF